MRETSGTTRPRTDGNSSNSNRNMNSSANSQRGGSPQRSRNPQNGGRKPQNGKSGKNMTVILASVLFCIVSGGGTYLYSQMNGVSAIIEQGGIYPNISIDGIDMEGYSVEDAVNILKTQHGKVVDGQSLNYTYSGENYPISLEEIDWKFHIEDAVQQAYDIGRTGSKKEITKIIRELEEVPLDITILVEYSEEKLEAFLLNTESSFATEPINSKMEMVDGSFVITPDVTGAKLDLQATLHNTLQSLETGFNSDIPLVVIEEPAKYTATSFDFQKDLIGAFTTSYSTSQTNRQNLETGAAYLDGTIIMPGETFSAGEGMGEQTAERGYVSAGVFVGGKLVNGMGGGICQVSTTVYNAALMAELEIVERWPHSMPVGYVPLGRDAAIADGYKDLVIKNNTDSPIYLEAYARGGVLAANFYGKEVHEEGRTVAFDTVLVSTTAKPDAIITKDATKYEDQRVVTYEGTGSKTVTVYKTITQNGQQVSREAFVNSTYRSMADEVTVGTKKRETVAEVEEPEEEVKEEVVEPTVTPTPNADETTPSVPETTTPTAPTQPAPEPEPEVQIAPSDDVVTEPEVTTPSVPNDAVTEPEPTPQVETNTQEPGLEMPYVDTGIQ